MASQAAQAAGKTARSMFSKWGKQDPELYVLRLCWYHLCWPRVYHNRS